MPSFRFAPLLALVWFSCGPPPATGDFDAKPNASLDAGPDTILDEVPLVDAGPTPIDPPEVVLDSGPSAPDFIVLAGELQDGDGAPLEDGTVSCDCGAETTTDGDGRWTLELAPGTYALAFSKDGFESVERVFDTDDTGEPWALVTLTEAGVASLVDDIDHAFLIEHFGGDPVNALDYADDAVGFQAYLDDVGVQFFSAEEIVTPYNAGAAADCGLAILLPEQDAWQKAGALAMFADQLRDLVDEPILLRNWWRPPCYNAAVGGAAGGDHPDADAVDLDFLSASSRATAQGYLCELYWAQDIVTEDEMAPGSDFDPRLNLSVGLGGDTIHLGVLSRNGRRHWTYSSYTDEPGAGACW